MKLLQINNTVNSGSTGRIAEEIGLKAIKANYESYIAAANTSRPSKSKIIQIGNVSDLKMHGLKTRLLDRHGFGSAKATKELVSTMEQLNPDLIHLHNIHGYYLHIRILFEYLKKHQKAVVWTFHDCWPFTGHCSYFDAVDCFKWQTECNHCPNMKGYPASWGLDQSKRNFHDKREIFNGLNTLQIITPSKWLSNHVNISFLSSYPVKVIYNGIDLKAFRPNRSDKGILSKYKLSKNPVLLGVASIWDKRKGLDDFKKISQLIDKKYQIVLVGLKKTQISNLPDNIRGIERTENVEELAALYSAAAVFVNPTYVDNFPTTNIEALACGTPVITYNTGGSPEAIDENTGKVVEKGNVESLAKEIEKIIEKGKEHYRPLCRARAEQFFNKDDRYQDYLKIYEQLILQNTTT
ncbi:MAG: glycosyltransferase [Bacteroidales bacterium]|nr:glycosyltransferase [Bacteroidales bacterium]